MKDYIKKYKEYLELIIPIIIRIIIYSNMKRYVLLGDSQDYISIEAGEYLNGFIHKRRMPLYPILIDFSEFIAKKLGNIEGLDILVTVQMTLGIISLIVFRKILEQWGIGKTMSYIMTLAYTLVPVWVFDKIILTESLAISGTVFFINIISKYINNPNRKSGILAITLSLFLTMLRPTFIINIVGVLIFYCIRFWASKEERRVLIWGILVGIFTLSIVHGYSVKFYENYGVYSLSATKVNQDFITTIMHHMNYLDSDNELSLAVQEEYDVVYDSQHENHDLLSIPDNVINKIDCNLKEISDYVDNCKRNNKMAYLKYYIMTLYYMMPLSPFENIYYGTNIYNCNYLYADELFISVTSKEIGGFLLKTISVFAGEIRYVHLYLLLIILIIQLKKNVKLSWLYLGLIMFILANILLAVYGTCGEFGRTSICVIPYSYVAVAIILNDLRKGLTNG